MARRLRRLILLLAAAAAWTPGATPRVRRASARPAAASDETQVFMRGIPWSASEDILRATLEDLFGTVEKVHMPRRADNASEHRGFAFVTFASHSAAKTALDAQSWQLLGRDVCCHRPQKQAPETGAVLSKLQRATRRDEIERCLNDLGPLTNTKMCNIVISAWARAKCADEALATFRQIESLGFEPDQISYASAIKACEKVGQWERALLLLKDMVDRKIEPDVITFTSAIAACASGGEWKRAVALLETMRACGVEPNAISYNAAISACEKGGKWSRAISLLDEMRARAIEPDVISLNAAISACEKGGQWERALALLDDMPARGLEPDVISFNAAISACEQCDEMAKAKLLYAEALALNFLPRMKNGEIDLHELSAPVARVAVAWSLDCLARRETPLPDSGLKIITGKGKHSEGNVAVLKPEMETMLASAEFAGLGAIEDARNAGRLEVRGENLRAWVAARGGA